MQTATEKAHVFEHIAPRPYRYAGVTRNVFVPCQGVAGKPGGTCDHCGAGIEWEFWFVAGDGLRFKVGSTCVDKSGDAGLRNVIAADVRKHQRDLSAARAVRTRDELSTLLANEATRAALSSRPHPNAFYASQGKTLADYYDFMARNSGNAGKARTLKAIKAATR